MIKNYQDFKFELLIESLVLESKIYYSDKFVNLIKQIKKNRIAEELLKLKSGDVDKDFIQNYIDTGKAKDEATFTADRKAKEFLGEVGVEKYKVVHGDRYLTHSSRNDEIYRRLNYTKPEGDPWEPPIGTVGYIKSEAQSNMSTRIYVWFESEDGRDKTVINKTALVPYDEKMSKVWSLQRNSIKIGRLVRSILNAAGVTYTDKEIEDFVNAYKSTYDILSDAFIKFDLVSGRDIAYWYNYRRYENGESTLGNSCMAEVGPEYFNIYCLNNACSLLILYSDGGQMTDGKYKSSRIKGRALVWKTDQGDTFMDRIYTNYDSDVDLFKKYAFDKGWWCKATQNSASSFVATNGVTTKEPEYTVKLSSSDFEKYPYVDSLTYINIGNKIISNMPGSIDADGEMDDTDGWYSEL